MRIPLTRIEFEYVLTTFIEELPSLYLQTGTVLHTLPPGSYSLKKSRVYFEINNALVNKKIVVFFNHKKRSISFDTSIAVHNRSCYFTLPDIAYKYDPDIRRSGKIITEIDVSDRFSITVHEHDFFPLDSIIHTGVKQPMLLDRLPAAYRIASQYMEERVCTENSIPLFLYRLYEFEDKIPLVFTPVEQNNIFMLFIDDKMMICGCRDRYTPTLENRQSLQFTVHFPLRYIRIMKGKTFFSHFITDTDAAIFGFLFEDIYEEDRRFLYENVYHEKYNPVHLDKRG